MQRRRRRRRMRRRREDSFYSEDRADEYEGAKKVIQALLASRIVRAYDENCNSKIEIEEKENSTQVHRSHILILF